MTLAVVMTTAIQHARSKLAEAGRQSGQKSVAAAQDTRSEPVARSERLASLIQGAAHGHGKPISRPTVPGYWKRRRHFDRLWAARLQRNMAADLLPFLQGPDVDLRQRAVQGLGRLESSQAEAPLSRLLQEREKLSDEQLQMLKDRQKPLKDAKDGERYLSDQKRFEDNGKRLRQSGLPPLVLQLALGRIRSRDFKGQEKVGAFAKSIGLSWDEVIQLSEKVNNPRDRAGEETPGYQIMEEVVDLLYTMRKRGEDISALQRPLTLNPVQELKLQAASLPVEQEIKLILDYLAQRPAVTSDELNLTGYLVALGVPAKEQVLQRLKDMKRQPERYLRGNHGYSIVFDTAAEMGDRRALPLLKHFERDTDRWVSSNAEQARQRLEGQPAVPG